MATYRARNNSSLSAVRVRAHELVKGKWERVGSDVFVPPGGWFLVDLAAGKRRADVEEMPT